MPRRSNTVQRGLVALLTLCSVSAAQTETRKPDPASAQPTAAGSSSTPVPGGDRLTPSELEELLGPIALYPDPLLANVLAASVYPDEVASAAAFVKGGGGESAIDGMNWEDPVKAVAKIPDAIKMMGEYPDWTVALGQAYLRQSKDVMDVVQSLRKQAQDNGALQSTPQQVVETQGDTIIVQPADPQVIYVPSYSPDVVYVDHYDSGDAAAAGLIGFGLGITTGLILANNLDCDWHGGCVGWGGGYHNDVDIDINGDVNIGNRVNTGDINRNRVGNEGNRWAPNKSKNLATSRPNQTQNFKQGATNRAATPGRTGTAGAAGAARSPAARPAGAQSASPRPQAKPAGAQSASRVPQNRPPSQAKPSQGGNRQQAGGGSRSPGASNSAFQGGRGTQTQSDRGARSRSASPSGGRSYSGGGGRSAGGGGGRGGGGGGRGGGGRR